VAGNCTVDKATVNSLRVLELLHRADVPVALGCERPLVGKLFDAAHVHGNDGLGGSDLPAPRTAASAEHAADQIARLARERPGEVTLVALGPLTNVAVALLREPRLPELLSELVVMGGAFAHPGNMTALAEFNIWVDPDAGRSVLEAPFRTTIVPLDATMQTLLTDDHLHSLPEGPIGHFVRSLTGDYLAVYERRHGRRAAAMHDPLATAIAIDRSLIAESRDLPISVETGGIWSRGQTVADRRHVPREPLFPGRATVVFKPRSDAFFDLFLPALRRR